MSDKLELITEHDIVKGLSYLIDKPKAKKLGEFDNGLWIDAIHINKDFILFSNRYFFTYYYFNDSEKVMNAENELFKDDYIYNVRLLDIETSKENNGIFINRFSKTFMFDYPADSISKIKETAKGDYGFAELNLSWLLDFLKLCKTAYKTVDKLPLSLDIFGDKIPSKFTFEQSEFYIMPIFRKEV